MNQSKRLILFKVFLIVLTLALFLIPHIIDRTPQIDSKVMMTTMGIDESETGIKVTVSAAAAKKAGDTGPSETVTDAEGKTISEALDRLNISMGKSLETAHCGLVVLGDDFSSSGVKDALQFLLNSEKIVDGAAIVCAVGKAEDLIKNSVKLTGSTSFSLNSFIVYATEDAQVPMLTLQRFMSLTYSPDKTAYLPCLDIGSEQAKGGEQSGGEQSGGGGSKGDSEAEGGGSSSGGGGDQPQTKIKNVNRINVFKDGVLAGKLDEKQGRSVTWLDKLSDRGNIGLDDFQFQDQSMGPISTDMRKKSVKKKAFYAGARLTVEIAINVNLFIEDSSSLYKLYYDGKTFSEIFDALRIGFKQKIIAEINEGKSKSLEYDADILKLGETVRRKYPEKYEEIGKDIKTFYENVDLKFKINVLFI